MYNQFRYSYVLNNPTKYTDPSGYAYNGYEASNAAYQNMLEGMRYDMVMQQEMDFLSFKEGVKMNEMHGGSVSSGGVNEYVEGASSPNDDRYGRPLTEAEKADFKAKYGGQSPMPRGLFVVTSGAAKDLGKVSEFCGNFANQNKGDYNINNAVNYLNSHAYDPNGKYKFGRGQCSPFTPNAINAGFGDKRIRNDLAGSAYGPILLKAGFSAIRINSLANYSALKGDIAVMNGPPGGKTCNTGIGGPCGHIQMYNGSQWVSDFFQTRPFWPGPDYARHTPVFVIYRW